ncbi:hypothetical protein Taro_038106 [Colocasia esculenta]|uniref:Uncharacterized protein n=1 Tax=Colocasia esculenta TaxID=4460 RepID=A0A843WEU2_COLES|nr:hypothetical protein [Colocasia esculenta]
MERPSTLNELDFSVEGGDPLALRREASPFGSTGLGVVPIPSSIGSVLLAPSRATPKTRFSSIVGLAAGAGGTCGLSLSGLEGSAAALAPSACSLLDSARPTGGFSEPDEVSLELGATGSRLSTISLVEGFDGCEAGSILLLFARLAWGGPSEEEIAPLVSDVAAFTACSSLFRGAGRALALSSPLILGEGSIKISGWLLAAPAGEKMVSANGIKLPKASTDRRTSTTGAEAPPPDLASSKSSLPDFRSPLTWHISAASFSLALVSFCRRLGEGWTPHRVWTPPGTHTTGGKTPPGGGTTPGGEGRGGPGGPHWPVRWCIPPDRPNRWCTPPVGSWWAPLAKPVVYTTGQTYTTGGDLVGPTGQAGTPPVGFPLVGDPLGGRVAWIMTLDRKFVNICTDKNIVIDSGKDVGEQIFISNTAPPGGITKELNRKRDDLMKIAERRLYLTTGKRQKYCSKTSSNNAS